MNPLAKAALLAQTIKWVATWKKHDSHYVPAALKGNSHFLSARDVARRIPDGAVCCSSGMAANFRCSAVFWGIREEFLATHKPAKLTWISAGGQGGRGRIPGTIEDLGVEGICVRELSGHLETLKSFHRLAERGKMILHALPQGVLIECIEAQARGEDSVLTSIGVGTYVDPRTGIGTLVTPGYDEQFVGVDGDRLRFHVPRIDVAIFVASYADEEGNLYMDYAPLLTEARESAQAAKRNGGQVFAIVHKVIPKDESRIFLRAESVDGIVVSPRMEQAGPASMRKPWTFLAPGSSVSTTEAVHKMKVINTFLKITPFRGPMENAMARAGAQLLTRIASPGVKVNIGTGLPEEVCRCIVEGGIEKDVTFLVETGLIGGLPAPGVWFGAAINPRERITSFEMFQYVKTHLDVTILGLLQADSDGNVNVSKRGESMRDLVGPGGFIDLTCAARNIVFIGTWMAHGKCAVEDGQVRILKKGTHKFVQRVDEVTFNGQIGLKAGKNIFYVTNVGIFKLTPRGMELIAVMPGIDVEKDILDDCPMRIVLPENGTVPTIEPSVVTGDGFALSW